MTTGTEQIDVTVADGVRFHLERSGVGSPVVLLHGFTGSIRTWDLLGSALADLYTTIAIDITGHGRSDIPADPARYALSRFAGDLCDILDVLEIERAALLGYSMGGRAALRFALLHPDRVAALVLESVSPGIADPRERADRIASDDALATAIERDGIVEFVDRWEKLPLWSNQENLPDDARNQLRRQRLENDPRGLANHLRGAGAGAEASVTSLLGDLRTTVQVVVGALDSKYLLVGRQMQVILPHARLDVVADAGHAAHLEQPGKVAALVGNFLSEVRSSDGAWG